QLRLAGVVRRRYDDRVAGHTPHVARARITNQPVRQRATTDRTTDSPLRRQRLLGGAITYKLDADQIAPATHVAHFVEPLERFPQVAAQRLSPDTDVRHQ